MKTDEKAVVEHIGAFIKLVEPRAGIRENVREEYAQYCRGVIGGALLFGLSLDLSRELHKLVDQARAQQ